MDIGHMLESVSNIGFREKLLYPLLMRNSIKAGAIAVALGDINTAEEMICNALNSRFDWDYSCSEEVGDILTNLAKLNLKTAEKIWKIVEKQLPAEFYLVMVAARTLENLSTSSY